MGDYSKASEGINEAVKTFSLKERGSADTAIRKLQSTTRNHVQANYGQRTRVMDELAGYEPGLPYAVAGQAMNALAPLQALQNA